MLRIVVALCLVGAAICGPPVSRSRSEIEKFRDFLESTRTVNGVVVGERQNSKASVWENSGKYQGDILLDDEQVESMIEQFAQGRNAYIWPGTRWPAGYVVYEFAPGVFDQQQVDYILYVMSEIEKHTCIRFRPKAFLDINYARITGNPDGCYASVGYWITRGVHTINLAPNVLGSGCFNPIVIIHEWLHVIGFFHMQATHNRDVYVRINWENINPQFQNNFDKYESSTVSNLGLPYQYDSCMHYGPYAFTINEYTTIDALLAHSVVMGQRSYITSYDFLRVDRHYNCVAWRKTEDYQAFHEDQAEAGFAAFLAKKAVKEETKEEAV